MRVLTQLTQLVFSWPASAQAVPGSSLSPAPHSLTSPATPTAAARALKGRFVHLTDLHPDAYYRDGAAESRACHPKKRKKKLHHGVPEWQGEAADEADLTALDDEEDDDDTDQELLLDDDDSEIEQEEDRHSVPHKDKGKGKGKGKGRKKRKKRRGQRRAGYWGLPVSDCDSPFALVNATFDWLAEHFRDQVDFVVWTGDNARHDIDSRLPRTLPEIWNLNRYIADRIRQTFGKDVPVVASIGNNDIYPHNVLAPGPNKITNEYLDVWSHFIPEHFQHTFARGGYYSVEAVKGDLLLVSLNTLYFYDRNAIVDGCPPADDDFLHRRWPHDDAGMTEAARLPHLDPDLSPTSPRAAELFHEHMARLSSHHRTGPPSSSTTRGNIDPGTEQLLWLEQQLTLARAQGMQVWLTGHVPATRDNWYPRCFEQYAELVLGWQDTIVGQLFGHMNVDFVSFITDADTHSSSLAAGPRPRPEAARARVGGPLRPLANDFAILSGLEKLYGSLPPAHKLDERDYAPVHVNPSVIPTYLPSVRVWEYNATRSARDEAVVRSRTGQDPPEGETEPSLLARWFPLVFGRRREEEQRASSASASRRREDRHSSPHAPGRTNTYLTPLSYTQYHIPRRELERANKAARRNLLAGGNGNGTASIEPPVWSVEYTTLSTSEAAARLLASSSSSSRGNCTKDPSRCQVDPVLQPALLPAPLQNLLATPPSAAKFHRVRRLLRKLDLTPYNGVMTAQEGLTVGAWIRMARWVTEKGQGDRWAGFRHRMGVGSGAL
ncbi:hypothetical protein JCM3774_006384 [Rhodotorula dairenensis]